MKVKQFQVVHFLDKTTTLYILYTNGILCARHEQSDGSVQPWVTIALPESEKHVRSKSTGKRPISDDDKPTDKHFELGKQLGLNVGAEWGKFKSYCLANNKRYANFEAAFRNWLTNEQFRKPKGGV